MAMRRGPALRRCSIPGVVERWDRKLRRRSLTAVTPPVLWPRPRVARPEQACWVAAVALLGAGIGVTIARGNPAWWPLWLAGYVALLAAIAQWELRAARRRAPLSAPEMAYEVVGAAAAAFSAIVFVVVVGHGWVLPIVWGYSFRRLLVWWRHQA